MEMNRNEPKEINILGVRVFNITKDSFKRFISSNLKGNSKQGIAKINAEFLVRAANDKEFADILNNFDLKVVDGRGVIWALKYLSIPTSNKKIIGFAQAVWQMIYSGALMIFWPSFNKVNGVEAIPGVEALDLVLEEASNLGCGVFFFGGDKVTIEQALHNLKREMPNLIISGHLDGYSYQKDKKIKPVEIINNSGARLLIVGLGSPKQEKWIQENLSKLKNVRIAVGEGGTLDRIANPLLKSPNWINRIGLEWLWRFLFNKSLTDNPGRNRISRVWNSVPKFIFLVVKYKINNGYKRYEK